MFNTLNQHLQANNIFVPKHFGFKASITIQRAIFTLTDNNILTTLNLRQKAGSIFCVLSKAFVLTMKPF
jgi:hypothetical protein